MLRSNFAIVTQLIRDTFRQACASGVCWMMLAVTAICVVLCLSVSVSGDVSLQAEDEPVLFLPPALPAAVDLARRQRAKGRRPLEVRSRTARREGVETISGRMTSGLWRRFLSRGRERARCRLFPRIDPCLGRRRHAWTADGPGMDRGIHPVVPGTERSVRPARQARRALAIAARQVLSAC